MNDLRSPIGIFFTLVGLLLLILGLSNPQARAELTPLNVNLYAGLVMFLFGSVMLWFARRSF
jgi:hypothetical protein